MSFTVDVGIANRERRDGYRLSIQDSDDVSILKGLIGFPAKRQRLCFAGKLLKDGGVMSSYGISNGCFVLLNVACIMDVIVNFKSGDKVKVRCNPKGSLFDLEREIRTVCEETGIYDIKNGTISLFFEGKRLNPNDRLLTSRVNLYRLNLHWGKNNVQLVLKEFKMIDIVVWTESNNSYQVRVDGYDKCDSIKNFIQRKEGTGESDTRMLFYKGQKLEDGKKIWDYNVEKGCIMRFVQDPCLRKDMHIKVNARFIRQCFEFKLNGDTFVENVKTLIHEQLQLAPAYQVLYLPLIRLENGKMIGQYDIDDSSEIELAIRMMKLYVLWGHDFLTLWVRPSHTISDLKGKLQELTNIDKDHQVLKFHGEPLVDDESFESQELDWEYTIVLETV